MTKLEQAARQALEAFPTLDEFFNRYTESIDRTYFNEADRIALIAVRELPRIEGALREALAHPKQYLDPAARNGWMLREVLFGNGEPVGHREPQPAAAEQEPVAWMFQHEEAGLIMCVDVQQVESGFEKNNPRWQKVCPLYKAPQPTRQPLTDEEIQGIWCSARTEANQHGPFWFARAIERAVLEKFNG